MKMAIAHFGAAMCAAVELCTCCFVVTFVNWVTTLIGFGIDGGVYMAPTLN